MTEMGLEIRAPREGRGDSLYNVKLTPDVDTGSESPGPETIDPYLGHCAIETLPDEVLEFIFIFYLNLYDRANIDNYYYYQLRGQRRLMAVSARWRALMLSTPKLWSYIGFCFREFSKLGKEERNSWARGVDMLLRRSKDYPLTVDIYMHIRNSQHEVDELGWDIIESLFAQCSRWRSVDLRFGRGMTSPCNENPSRKLSIDWPLSFPQLESLTISNDSWSTISESSIRRDPSGVFLNAPSLKCLRIGNLEFQDLQCLQFPFSQIRTLRLPRHWSRQAVLQTLQAVTHLDYLLLDLRDDRKEIFAAPMKVSCRELVLSVENHPSRSHPMDGNYNRNHHYMFPSGPGLEIAQFFERVQFVGTKSITLESYDARWTAAQIQGFLQSIQPSMLDLTSLSLRYLVFGEKDLISLLRLLPSLRTLRIYEQYLDNDPFPVVREAFFRALTIPQADSSQNADGATLHAESAVIIPQLVVLELTIRSGNFTVVDSLVDMVRSRPRLSLLNVEASADVNERQCVNLEEMVEDLKQRLSCRPDLRIQGKEFRSFLVELQSEIWTET
jgi:hypothetical protein